MQLLLLCLYGIFFRKLKGYRTLVVSKLIETLRFQIANNMANFRAKPQNVSTVYIAFLTNKALFFRSTYLNFFVKATYARFKNLPAALNYVIGEYRNLVFFSKTYIHR